MDFKDRFFKLRLKFTDFKIKLKRLFPAFLTAIKSVNREKIKNFIQSLIFGIKPLIRNTPTDLTQWDGKTAEGKIRYLIFFAFLCLVFSIVASSYAFTANDAFISFRYVSNAVNGYGYTYNLPPFEPVSGFTSFLWLLLLRELWAIGLQPPQSAELMTFWFSMGQVFLCFFFIRHMNIQKKLKNKSLFLFLAVCLILLTNRTFLAFMSSGTETALFNFLVLWWTFELSIRRNPLYLSVAALLLGLCRFEGFIFILATVPVLLFFILKGPFRIKSVFGCVLLCGIAFYYHWLNQTYGSFIPHVVSSSFNQLFPDIGRDYLLSFILEYALYFWLIFFIIWLFFKFAIMRQKGFGLLFLLILTFAAYIGYYLFIMGGDILEYRPLSFFIPLSALAGIKLICENICSGMFSFATIILFYLLISTSIPWTHRDLTKNLETRRETEFLYRPVAKEVGWFGFFAQKWDQAQRNLIYQGVGLRHQEHKVLTQELLKTFPSREEGSRIKKSANRLFAWDFVGVAGWVLPEVIIIDLSGQNNAIVAGADFKYQNRRLFGHERNIPAGYVQCFNGGNSVYVDPFSGKKNFRLLKAAPLSDGKIKGCEGFWKSQINAGKAKSLRIKSR